MRIIHYRIINTLANFKIMIICCRIRRGVVIIRITVRRAREVVKLEWRHRRNAWPHNVHVKQAHLFLFQGILYLVQVKRFIEFIAFDQLQHLTVTSLRQYGFSQLRSCVCVDAHHCDPQFLVRLYIQYCRVLLIRTRTPGWLQNHNYQVHYQSQR